MKKLLLFLFLFCAGCSFPNQLFTLQNGSFPDTSPANSLPKIDVGLPDLGVAPEIQSTVWLNVDKPLQIADMKGKVVVLNMWTYGCFNCRNVVPKLVGWHEKYAEKGLVIIGNHFPEFEKEKDIQNLTTAMQELGINYPVTQDNDGLNWRAYKNRFWPTLYLIDKRGHIRYSHIGEGGYDSTEDAIRELLAE